MSDAKSVTWSKFHSEEPQIVCTTEQNSVAQALRTPGWKTHRNTSVKTYDWRAESFNSGLSNSKQVSQPVQTCSRFLLQTPESSSTFFHTQMEKMTCHWSHHPAIPLKFLPSIIPAWRKSYLFSGETNVSVIISTSYIYSVHWCTYKNSVKLPQVISASYVPCITSTLFKIHFCALHYVH
jgi:hypothetical protein